MAQEVEKMNRQVVARRRTADKLKEQQLNLWYAEKAWDLKERKMDFYFHRFILIALLVFWGYVLVKSSLWGIPAGVAATAMAYALRFALSRIRQKSENGQAHDLKSLIRLWIEEKSARRRLPHL
jgi:hypothetical protein